MFDHDRNSYLDGVCTNTNTNCAIVFIKYVSSIWTMAHEIMHTLGVRHDKPSTNKCNGIMGTTNVGTPETFIWTRCTNNYLDIFLSNTTMSQCLDTSSGTPLRDWNPLSDPSNIDFHSYSVDEQCSLNWGPKYSRLDKSKVDCTSLPCGYDLLYLLSVGRPLERTICGENPLKRCALGNCVRV